MFNIRTLSLCSLLLGVAACTSTPPQQSPETHDVSATGTIAGMVTYRERIALPDNATLTIKLEDTAKQDVASRVIAEKTINLSTPPPWQFNLDYDPQKLEAKGYYTLRARVEVDGKLRFINMSQVDAFNTTIPVSILVTVVAQQVNNDQLKSEQLNNKQSNYHQAMLEAHSWELTEINGAAVSIEALDVKADKDAPTKRSDINFNEEEKRINGFSGCNNFSGSYNVSETTLKFPPIMSTMMVCPASDTEFKYLKALGMVNSYSIKETILSMLDKQGHALLKFKIKSVNK